MRISELVKVLEREKELIGDVQVTMQATLLKDGFSQSGSDIIPDVFESTVETVIAYNKESENLPTKRLRLFWQK